MINSWKDGKIVFIKIEGEFIADELIGETTKWLSSHAVEYVGYVIDICGMTKQSAIEQKKAEEAAKKSNSGKPRALVGKDAATAALVNIYKRFTGAKDMRYFTNMQEAKDWVLNFNQ
ncbi:MAG: hypothetical protein CL609_16125 [Anaerolineaceae bacterium]|nr:hypothetical protein [Anaerolineaceae bacterium]